MSRESDSLSLKDFIVFIDVVQTTIARDESGDLLTVLNELDTDALTNSGVRLLGFNTTKISNKRELRLHLFKNNTLGHSSSTEDVSLNGRDVVTLLILLHNQKRRRTLIPYQPIFPDDGQHGAYEQHEYHKVYYSQTLEMRSRGKNKYDNKESNDSAKEDLPFTHFS